MLSSIVIFVLVFAVLGLLLGFASIPTPRVTIGSIAHYDYELNSTDISHAESEHLVGLKVSERHGLLRVTNILPANSTAVVEMRSIDPNSQVPIPLKPSEELVDGCSRTIKFLKIYQNDTAVFVYPDESFRFSCDESSFSLVSKE